MIDFFKNISVSNTPKGPGFDVARKFFGDGLVMQHYEKWKNRRKILSNGFQGSVISKYIPVMSDVCKFWVKKLDQQVNKPLNVVRLCQKIGMDIVCATAMGMTNLENPSKKEDEYRNAIEIAVEMILIRAINPFYWFDCIFNKTKDGKRSEKAQSVIRNFSAQLIEDKIEYHSNESDNNSNKVKDFASLLDYLVKIYLNKEDEDHSNNEKINFSISLDGVQEEVNTALFAGNESTASTIAWTLFLLGCNENAQQLVYQEIKQVFGEKGDNVQCSEESLKKLKFLECCIKESMRLCPSIHTITRKTPSDILLGGHVIPSGTVLSICIYYIHRNANYYPEPDVFKPERFLPENSVNRPKNSFIPFGFGHRQCLGQNMAMREIKILISQIVCRFQVQSCSKYEDIAAAFLGTLKSTTAVEMVFQRR